MMQGSISKRFSLLALGALVALAVAAPAHAIDCEKTTVNRTGVPQFGQLVFMFGPEIFTEKLVNEPFAQAESQFFGLDTLLAFSDAATGAIPSTNAAVAPEASVCHTGFSVADHRFSLFGWTWADQNGQPTADVPDPGFSFKWDAKSSSVFVTLRNDTGRTEQLLRGRFSMSFSNPRLESQVTDPLPPVGPIGPNGPQLGTYPKETVLMTVGDMVLPPFPAQGSVRTFQIRLNNNNNNGGGELFAVTPQASPYVIFRSIAYFPEDVNHRNPAAFMVADQPLRSYPTCLFLEGACAAGYATSTRMLPVLLHVYAQDPDGTVPNVVLDSLTSTDAGALPDDMAFNPNTGVAKSVGSDPMGHPVTKWTFLVWLRQSPTKDRHYKVRFKAPDATLERTLTVSPG
jgi:hypothetical protein